MGGIADGKLRAAITDPATQAQARRRIESDWKLAREEYEIFGVPTLRFAGDRPIYVRLGSMVTLEDGPELLQTLRAVRSTPAGILELKLPEPVSGDAAPES